MSDPRGGTALPGLHGRGPGAGCGWAGAATGSAAGAAESGLRASASRPALREEFCLPSDSDRQTRAGKVQISAAPAAEAKFLYLPPGGHLLVSPLPPRPQGQAGGHLSHIRGSPVQEKLGATPALSQRSNDNSAKLSQVPSASRQGGTHFLFAGSRGFRLSLSWSHPLPRETWQPFPQTAGFHCDIRAQSSASGAWRAHPWPQRSPQSGMATGPRC